MILARAGFLLETTVGINVLLPTARDTNKSPSLLMRIRLTTADRTL